MVDRFLLRMSHLIHHATSGKARGVLPPKNAWLGVMYPFLLSL